MSLTLQMIAEAAHDKIQQGLLLFVLLFVGWLPLATTAAWGQAPPITQHNDNLRTGANLSETILTTANVNVTTFGMINNLHVDGTIYAQPLYAPAVSIGGGTHNVLYVATSHDSVYAFDADTGLTLAGPVSLGISVPTGVLFPEDGIISTPVLDPNSNTLYVVAKTYTAATGVQNFYLHALSSATLQDKSPPTVITAQVPGTGFGAAFPLDNSGGNVFFIASQQLQRPALTLVTVAGRPVVYIAFGSIDDNDPYHGWLLGYDAATLTQVCAFNDTPNGGQGGIWMSGQGPVVDPSGNLYVMTGNSSQATENNSADYGESFLKLTPGAGAISVTDYFKVFNYDSLNAADNDLGSGGVLGIPGTNYIVGGGKQGIFYLVDTTNMGKLSTTGTDNVRQEWQANSGLYGSPVFWNNSAAPTMYVWSGNDQLKAYPFSYATGLFTTTPSSVSAFYSPPGTGGGVLTLSANGSTPGTGIVWATVPASDPESSSVLGTLYAYDATNLANQLWSSSLNPAQDAYGNYAKFCPPTVAGGKVFVATNSGQVSVYGLLALQAPTGLSATSAATSATLTWTAQSSALTYNIYRGTVSKQEAATPIATGVTGTTYTDTGLTSGTQYYYTVTAVSPVGQSVQSLEAIAVPNTTGTTDYQINSGGTALAPFAADAFYTDPTVTYVTKNAITVTGVPNAAPAAVYQTARSITSGTLDYTFKGLTPSAPYTVRVHESENWDTSAAPRLFNLLINGTQVWTNFSIRSAAAGVNIAVVRNFNTVADTNGNIFIQGISGNSVTPIFCGFEILNGTVTAAPTGLTAAGISGQVALTWPAVTGATSYNLYRSATSGGEGSVPIATGLTGTSYTNTGLASGKQYFYLLTAVNANGESALSTEVTNIAPVPTAPTGLTATSGNTQVILTWTAVTGATSYSLYRATVSGAETLYKTNLTGTTYTDTGLTDGTVYFYTLSAVNTSGASAQSNEASATPVQTLKAPTATSSFVTTALNTAVGITLIGVDLNSPAKPLTYTVTSAPAHGTLTGTAPSLTYTPASGYLGADSFQFKVNNGTFDSAIATVSIIVNATNLANSSFETPVVGSSQYKYNPTGGTWVFTGTSGIQSNGSAFGVANAPDGTQTALLQGHSGSTLGSISQSVKFTSTGSYVVSFMGCRRNNSKPIYNNPQPIKVSIDGVQIGSFMTPPSNTWTLMTTSSFTISTTGSHTITLSATDSSTDKTSFVDLVTITQVPPPVITNGSFETPSMGAANYQYRPTGGTWTFTGQSGIQSNKSAWLALNAPDGTQTAFLQGYQGNVLGSISQNVNFASTGTYKISFYAARRNIGSGGQVQPIQLSLDGVNIGSALKPASTSWGLLTSSSFTITTTGSHKITLSATDNSTDKTTFVDVVTIN